MMNGSESSVIELGLLRALSARGSWCGETHLQKGAYLLAELQGIEVATDFTLYKHGPFSFDLRDELSELKGDGLIGLKVRAPRYGPSLEVTERGEALMGRSSRTLERYERAIDAVASILKDRGVADLERLTTAIYVQRELGRSGVEAVATEMRKLKPHVTWEDAVEAAREAIQLLESGDSAGGAAS